MKLENLRAKIDTIDKEILLLLKKRLDIITKLKKVKDKLHIETEDKKREEEVLLKLKNQAMEKNIDTTFVEEIFKAIINASKKFQNENN